MDREVAAAIGRAHHGSSGVPELLDFSANVNPTTPPGVEAVFTDAFAKCKTYPPEPPLAFNQHAAASVGCAPEHIIPTPGAMAAIRLAIGLFVERGDSVLIPSPSFSEYEREVRLHGGVAHTIDAEGMTKADPAGHSLAIVCNPNNPTGTLYSRKALRKFAERCRAVGTTLLIDEAFLDFTDQPSLAGKPGVIVARSLTKMFGLPGLRMGFAVATVNDRKAMEGARPPWNISMPARLVGQYCLKQHSFVEETKNRVRTERHRLEQALSKHFDIHPSEAPFLLLQVGDESVETFVTHARERGIELRDATTFRGLDAHLRVAVRLPKENTKLIRVLTDV